MGMGMCILTPIVRLLQLHIPHALLTVLGLLNNNKYTDLQIELDS